MKYYGFILCLIVFLALFLISYAGRSYPSQIHNPKVVEAQKGVYHPQYGGGWGSWPP